ncbi:MAG: hypothetical protein KAU14_04405, partial [Thermoplasmata archaeon]|nr:hypothetical protein [Thermoplasmata archaeon]
MIKKEASFMKTILKIHGIIFLGLLFLAGLSILLLAPEAAGDGCVTARLDETSFEVDTSGGPTSITFEPELTVENTDEDSK